MMKQQQPAPPLGVVVGSKSEMTPDIGSSSTTLLISSSAAEKQQQWDHNKIKQRRTRIAAYRFLSILNDDDDDNKISYDDNDDDPITMNNNKIDYYMDWKTIPLGLERLCQDIRNWELYYDTNNDTNDNNNDELLFYDSCAYDENNNNELKDARIASMNASIQVLGGPIITSSLQNAIESLLRASLEYRCYQQHRYQKLTLAQDNIDIDINDGDDDDDTNTDGNDENKKEQYHEYIQALLLQKKAIEANDNSRNDDKNEDNDHNKNINSKEGDHVNIDNNNIDIHLMEQRLFYNLRIVRWIINRECGLFFRQLCSAIHQTVLKKIHDTILYDQNEYCPTLFTEHISQWKDTVIEFWLVDILHGPTIISSSSSNYQQHMALYKQGYICPNLTPTTSTLPLLKDVEPKWKLQLDILFAELYTSIRMEQIFSIVTDYPDSHGTVLELKHILENKQPNNDNNNNNNDDPEQQHQYNRNIELAYQLRSSLIRRLNHPGASTTQIIDVYIATIKVLRLIDPSDRLLSIVAEPVRTYLRGRNDTIRCIITSLTDAEVGGDLYQELRRQDAKPLENINIDSDDEEDPPDLYNWQPLPSIHKPLGTFVKPIHSNSTTSSSHNNNNTSHDDCDILAMLVSIYGSKELFVDEYRLMLADKLLANLDYNTDKEVHTLELLKLRFGEISMRNCEVMIKDMDDSKRSNTLIHSSIEANIRKKQSDNNMIDRTETNNNKCVVDAVMVSHIFWPALHKNMEQLKHHPRIQSQLDIFSDMYGQLKNPRKLDWMNQLGTVQIELYIIEERNNTTPTVDADMTTTDESSTKKTHIEKKNFNCSPLLATLITHFEDKPIWTSEELSNETGQPEHIIQKRMAYWVSHLVVTSTVGTTTNNNGTNSSSTGRLMIYELASYKHRQQQIDMNTGDDDNDIYGDDNNNNNSVSASIQEQEEMEVYESFITAMLKNNNSSGSCTLERIHNMLKMFVSAGSETKYQKTPQQLYAFLQHLCRQEKLECGPDGMYKLFKKE